MALTVPQYTVADLDRFQDDGNRYELLAGTLIVTPSPSTAHQGAAAILAATFAPHILNDRIMLYSPGVLRVPPTTHLEPDILIVPPAFARNIPWVEITEHWLAVEVLSHSSRVYDREFKRDAYLAMGVREVWLVDLNDRSIEICAQPGNGRVARDVMEWRVPGCAESVRIDLNALFAKLG